MKAYQIWWRYYTGVAGRERAEGGVGVGTAPLKVKGIRVRFWHPSIFNTLKAFKDFGRSRLPTLPLSCPTLPFISPIKPLPHLQSFMVGISVLRREGTPVTLGAARRSSGRHDVEEGSLCQASGLKQEFEWSPKPRSRKFPEGQE